MCKILLTNFKDQCMVRFLIQDQNRVVLEGGGKTNFHLEFEQITVNGLK